MSEIMQALYRGDGDIARRLAESADLDVFESAALGQVERLRELLAGDPALAKARSEDDFTALHYAAFFDGPDTARLLVEHGADVNAFADNELGVHPLNSAAAAGQRDVAAILLEHGADPNAPTRSGFSPLDAARENGDEKLAALLRSRGADDEAATEAS
jgi:ankyrin repeat protein